MVKFKNIFLVTIFCILPFLAFGQSNSNPTNEESPVKVEILQEDEGIQPNHPFWVAIKINLEKDWHIYWKNPGDTGLPLELKWNLPPGFTINTVNWPCPEKLVLSDMVSYGYHQEVILLAQITPPQQLDSLNPGAISLDLEWLVCSDMNCLPGSGSYSLPIKTTSTPKSNSSYSSLFENARKKIPLQTIQIKATRKSGIIELEIPKSDSLKTAKSIEFYPETHHLIDCSKTPLVSEQDSNRSIIQLPEGTLSSNEIKQLKGILVVHEESGWNQSIKSFEINAPLDHQTEIAFLDRNELSKQSSDKNLAQQSAFDFEGGLGLALLFAFVGGMILNLMPCVLPVISIKVMSFIKMAGQSRALTMKHGLVFSLGVILSFWFLAIVMLSLRSYGHSVGWGFQLQEPIFIVILASFLFIFALNLFGVFEIGLSISSWAGQTQSDQSQKQSSYTGSFLSGILATAVATPCTGPFLGSAVGFAVTLPIFQSLLIFTSLALGMCFPYLILAGFPSLLRFIPKPGAWMETFKQLMGFLLLATVLWLLWVFSAQTNTFSLICLLAGFFCFSIGAWIYGRGSAPLVSKKKQILAYLTVFLLAFIGWKAITFPQAGWSEQEMVSNGKSH
ncbi:MAG: protein-disulfide reductase DsbD family protein, partial [Parachlamydiaceae bacterium]|nr:protein-disulfide reductase DsbD family protein [Parachlamydiaceae bacterium]